MNWSDWVDYWSVDFDFENKKIIIQDGKNKWTNDYIFENEWQSLEQITVKLNFRLHLKNY